MKVSPILEYMFFKSRLDETSISSLISAVKYKFSTSTLMSIFGVITCLSVFMFFQTIISTKNSPYSRQILYQALLKIVLPTRSIWPSHYYRVLAQSSQNAPITFSSTDLVDDIIQGNLELRNATQDLVDIVKGRVGSNIVFAPGASQHAKALYWILRNEFSSILGHGKSFNHTHIEMPNSTLRDRILKYSHRISTVNAGFISPGKTVTSTYSQPEVIPSRQHKDIASVHFSLDRVPRSKLPEFVKYVQKTVYSGTCSEALIELSTCERPFSVSDDSISHIVLPFLRRRSNADITSTFLFVSLPTLLSFLTSGATAVTIIAVQNISFQRAAALDAYVRLLNEESTVRQIFEGDKDLESWRGEKLYAQWEAALYRSNLLSRWIITFKSTFVNGEV